MREVYGQVIAAERAKHHGELAELKVALEERIDALAAELSKQRGVDDGAVIDLPALPSWKRNARLILTSWRSFGTPVFVTLSSWPPNRRGCSHARPGPWGRRALLLALRAERQRSRRLIAMLTCE